MCGEVFHDAEGGNGFGGLVLPVSLESLGRATETDVHVFGTHTVFPAIMGEPDVMDIISECCR